MAPISLAQPSPLAGWPSFAADAQPWWMAQLTPEQLRLWQRFAYLDYSIGYMAVRHHIRHAAQRHGVDERLIKAVIAVETGFEAAGAVSHRGAIGLMQLMPATARYHGAASAPAGDGGDALGDAALLRRLADPAFNIDLGARHLAWLFRRFDGRLDLVLAAYNAGHAAVLRAGLRVPDIGETRHYVRTVEGLYRIFQAIDELPAPPAPALPGASAAGRG